MLGISKESWMVALEKENYLKAAEMSMEDDYGMIDGIINNGPKEDKTAEVKADVYKRQAYYYIKFVKDRKPKDEDMDFFDDEGYEEEPYINEDEEPQIAEDAETDGDED